MGDLKSAFYLVVGVVFIMSLVVSFGDNSEGVRKGVPVKLSYKGWVWKTHEGQLSISGLQSGGVPYIWEFTVCSKNTDLIKKIHDALDKGEQITVKYTSPLLYFKWIQKSQYCVLDVGK